jgi:4'-phosphopantetheinyl transferase
MGLQVYWTVQCATNLPDADEWMSEAERKHLAAFRFPKRRADWKLGRWTAKRVVSAALGINANLSDLATLEIRAAPDGAPEVYLRGGRAPVSLSISHSFGTSLCAAGPVGLDLGCDIEQIIGHDPSFAADYFAPEEVVLLRRIREAEHPFAVTLVWSAKESALKGLREGLRRDTRSVVVDLDFGSPRDIWNPFTARCAETSRMFTGWWRAPGPHVLTIAAARQFTLRSVSVGA